AAAALAHDGSANPPSGEYRRKYDAGERRYSPTLAPRSGAPIDNAVASVTVLHRHCMQADALATALTVLGAHAGIAYANRHNLAALFVLREGDGFVTRTTPGFVACQRAV
ncbi:FAD:protein FMN transferase, partial [Lysobacter sp. 2RAB21]